MLEFNLWKNKHLNESECNIRCYLTFFLQTQFILNKQTSKCVRSEKIKNQKSQDLILNEGEDFGRKGGPKMRLLVLSSRQAVCVLFFISAVMQIK